MSSDPLTDGGHTLVDLSVYLVLTVLVLGLALTATTTSRRAVSVWETETRATNALAGMTSRIDADLRQTRIVSARANGQWELGLSDGRVVGYRSADGRVFRNDRLLHDESVAATLGFLSATSCPPSPCTVRVRLSVRTSDARRGVRPRAAGTLRRERVPQEWTVLLRPSPWSTPAP